MSYVFFDREKDKIDEVLTRSPILNSRVNVRNFRMKLIPIEILKLRPDSWIRVGVLNLYMGENDDFLATHYLSLLEH